MSPLPAFPSSFVVPPFLPADRQVQEIIQFRHHVRLPRRVPGPLHHLHRDDPPAVDMQPPVPVRGRGTPDVDQGPVTLVHRLGDLRPERGPAADALAADQEPRRETPLNVEEIPGAAERRPVPRQPVHVLGVVSDNPLPLGSRPAAHPAHHPPPWTYQTCAGTSAVTSMTATGSALPISARTNSSGDAFSADSRSAARATIMPGV